jgi:hypothetical protein
VAPRYSKKSDALPRRRKDTVKAIRHIRRHSYHFSGGDAFLGSRMCTGSPKGHSNSRCRIGSDSLQEGEPPDSGRFLILTLLILPYR